MAAEHREIQRRYTTIGIIAACLIGVIIIMAQYFITAQGIRRDLLNPPVVLLSPVGEIRESEVYKAEPSSELCLGGYVEWYAHVRAVRNADSNIWRFLKRGKPGAGTTVRTPDRESQIVTIDFASFEEGNESQALLRYNIPDWLTPGEYYILNSIQNGTGRPVRYAVPFTVTASCDTREE